MAKENKATNLFTAEVLAHTTDLVNKANSNQKVAIEELSLHRNRIDALIRLELRKEFRRFVLGVSGLLLAIVSGILAFLFVQIDKGAFDASLVGFQVLLAALAVSALLSVGLIFAISLRAGIDIKKGLATATEATLEVAKTAPSFADAIKGLEAAAKASGLK